VLRASGALARELVESRAAKKKKSRHPVAGQQPQVSGGELVDFYSLPATLGL
jgi:hypothetical protein